MASVKDTIKEELESFVTKIAWKQLDIVRHRKLQNVEAIVNDMQIIVDEILSFFNSNVSEGLDLAAYATKIQLNQIEFLLSGRISILEAWKINAQNTIDFLESVYSNAEMVTNKGVAGGYPSLQMDGKIPLSQLPNLEAASVDWANINNLPITFTPAEHDHNNIDGGTF